MSEAGSLQKKWWVFQGLEVKDLAEKLNDLFASVFTTEGIGEIPTPTSLFH